MLEARRSGPLACAGLALLALLLFHEVAFGGRSLFERDTAFWYYPQSDDVVRILTSGAWPLWHPYRSFGEPLLANLSNQILYPPAYLHLLLEPWTAYTWYVIGHLVFSGMGEYLFARRLGLSALGSFLAAAGWMTSGPLLSTVNMWNHFSGATWLPWALLAARQAGETLRPRDALLWGGALAAQLMAGSPDASALAALASGAVFLLRLRGAPRATRRTLGIGALAAAFALGLAAVQWLPTADLLPGSRRMNLEESARTRWSTPPAALFGLGVPVFVKGLRLEGVDPVVSDDSVRNPLLASLYLGAPMLVLAAAGVFGPARPLRGCLAGMAALACCIALGSHAPFLAAFSTLLPLHGIFRHPVKAMLLVPLAAGPLAGMGLDALRGGAARARSLPALVCGGLLVCGCALVAGAALAGLRGGLPLPFRPEPLLPPLLALTARQALLASLAALAVLLLLRRGAAGRRTAVAVSALAIAELAFANYPINPSVPTELLAQRPATVAAIAADGAPRGTRVYAYDYVTRVLGKRNPPPELRRVMANAEVHSPARVLGMRMLYPFCGRWGLSGSYEADVLGFSAPYMQTLVISLRAAEETPHYLRLLQLGGVGYVLALHRESFADLIPVAEVPGSLPLPIQVFRVPDPQPHVYAVGIGRPVGPDAGYRALTDPDFDFREQVLLASGPIVTTPGFAARVKALEQRPDRLRVDAEFDGPGYLVATQSYDPRWRASVDGKPAELLRANVGFQAVLVPPGRHTVELRYRPPAFLLGACVSAVALLAGLFVCASGRTPRHAQ